MKNLKTPFQLLTLLLLVASLLLPTLADAKRVSGVGTFRDRKGGPGDEPGPDLKNVTLRNIALVSGPEGPPLQYCEAQPNGACEVDLTDPQFAGFTTCDHFIGFFVFGVDPFGNPNPSTLRFDVTCHIFITIDFTGIMSGSGILDDTFFVRADGTGGGFSGPLVGNITFTDPTDGTAVGPGRVDFFRNNGKFGPDFVGSGRFVIDQTYGAVAGVTGFGLFSGTIGQQGNYSVMIDLPDSP